MSPTPKKTQHLVERFTEARLPIKTDLALAELTTYKLGGNATLAILPETPKDLAMALSILHEEGSLPTILGGGSNVLMADRGCTKPLLSLHRMKAISCSEETITADAGVNSSRVADVALVNALTGAEFLTWLPGSIGGAAFMNARAFGSEMSNILITAQVVTHEGDLQTLSLSPEAFSYKISPFRKKRLIVANVELGLSPGSKEDILQQMESNRAHRRKNGENKWPSCGCVFKNPMAYGTSAGKIIDNLGLKGFGSENVWVHKEHGNFIVHNGKATAREVREFMDEIRRRVKEALDLTLEFEVEFEGDWNE